MPFTRRARVPLTPPTWPTFVISLILAVVAIASHYARIPWVSRADNHFWVMTAAYVLLVLGVLLRGV